ncbi:MAG: hypothetical protein OHK0038_04900 [Flammeovirgaceae bacterium]
MKRLQDLLRRGNKRLFWSYFQTVYPYEISYKFLDKKPSIRDFQEKSLTSNIVLFQDIAA